MVKKAISIIIPLIIGILISYWIFNRNENKAVNTSGDVIIERIKAVKKLVVTEGQFSEVYNYKEAQKYFYNLISFEKKALLLVKGKVLVSYDLEAIEYEVNKKTKVITLTKVPEPETTIEPSIKYYDLQESTFNSFSPEDYNKLNNLAIKKLKEEISKSNLYDRAEESLERTLGELQWVGKELGWKVIIKSKT
mgnify:CR=1 FL=1